MLDGEQRAVVDGVVAGGRSTLVIGAPGSGKTLVLREALVAGLADLPATQVLGVAPTASAAQEWRRWLSARTGQAPTITTLHSLALRLVQEQAAMRGATPPRLLAGEDQLALIRGVLAEGGIAAWPSVVRDAVRTRAFAGQVRDFISSARLAGLTLPRLRARQAADPMWPALADVWHRYSAVKGLAQAMDYQDLLERAAQTAGDSGAPPWHLICVDHFAELDGLQVRLLRALAEPAAVVLAASDPDSVVDRFRGASPAAVSQFGDLFPNAGKPVVLTGRYRFSEQLETARRSLLDSVPMPGLPAALVRAHRTGGRALGAAAVDVLTYPDAASESAGIADLARRFALAEADGSAPPRWANVAVLARSAEQLLTLEQALLTAGVPVQGAEVGRPLGEQTVVVLLATALSIAARAAGCDVPEPAGHRVVELLTSPMAGIDPPALRRVVLALRRAERANAVAEDRLARSADSVLTAALVDPAPLLELDPKQYPAVRPLLAVQRRVERAAELIRGGADAEQPLWALWSDQPTGPGSWARRLREAAVAGGTGSPAAHRDLDAAMALFAHVRRSQARGGSAGVQQFLADLPDVRWPAQRLAALAYPRNAVQLMTVNRAQGREWSLVVVAGVQEGVWPAANGGLGLLSPELLRDPETTAVSERAAAVADERRLFHVACSRATEHLVLTAVAADERDPAGAQPSRFLAELGVPARPAAAARRRLTRTGLLAGLRCAAAEPGARSQQALWRLAGLQGDADFPGADPGLWWGANEPTRSEQPLVALDQPLRLTVTGLTELTACPWRWFATRVLYARPEADASAGIGQLVHRVHQAWVDQEIERDLDSAQALVDQVWPALAFDAQWHSQRRREDVGRALQRLLSWLRDNADRVAFAEQSFSVDIESPNGDAVTLTGKADIAVRSGAQGLAILDIKTAKSPPARAEVERHVQLAGYQQAVLQGALGGQGTKPAGAALLMASVSDTDGGAGPKVLWQSPLDSSEDWFGAILAQAAEHVRREEFPAVVSGACRTCPVQPLCPARNPAQEVALC